MALGDKKVTLEGLRAVYQHIEGEIEDVRDSVSGLFYDDVIDTEALNAAKGTIGSNLKWNATGGYGVSFNVSPGMKKVRITANSEIGAVIIFLRSAVLTHGESVSLCEFPDLSDTSGRRVLNAGTTEVFKIPDDCVLIRVQTKATSGGNNTPASLVFEKQIMQVADDEKIQEQFSDVNVKLPMPEIVVPYVFRWCVGKQCNFYYQNAVRNFDIRKAVYCRISAWSTFDEFARWQPNSAVTGRGANFNVFPYNMSNAVSATIHYDAVAADAGSGLTKNVMLIGDSLTENSPLSKHLIDDLFANDVMSIKLVGTKGTGLYLREGRSGWSPSDYVRHASINNGSSDVLNPFYNPSTETFDFSYYMQENGNNIGLDSGEDIDYVFLNLGTNISSEDYEITVDDMIADMEIMVQSILAYAAERNRTIRIGVWTPPPRALVSKANLPDHNNTMARVKAIIDAFDRRWDSKIYVVPVGYNVDPYHDFDTTAVNVSMRNSRYQMDILTNGDFTHPADEGYFKMADVIYCMIKYFGSLDAT